MTPKANTTLKKTTESRD